MDKQKQQARERAARHYAQNKDSINKAKRLSYIHSKCQLDVNAEVPAVDIAFDDRNELICEKLGCLGLNPNTLRTYRGSLTRLLHIIDDECLITKMRDGISLVQAIKDSGYSSCSQRGMIQVCLFVVTRFKLSINKKSIDVMTAYFDELKRVRMDEVEEQQRTESVLPWSEYLCKVDAHFGKASKMGVLGRLYCECTNRDDYVMRLTYSLPTDATCNWLFAPKRGVWVIVVNQYKMAHKFGAFETKLSKEMTTTMREWVSTNRIHAGEYVFGSKQLSGYIIQQNKKIGIHGGVSLFRRMTISQHKGDKASDRALLAARMKHGMVSQSGYVRTVMDESN